ncbi:L,D-transpeptidase family protein [Oceanivirga salmonicida]|uniref:L,D-transpeptidase family protein n=1 Tax=Oceanivirga salmonicida TaxID=1769291 RepID=UPI0012E1422B|nr:L,D-transpeptidase family protein [Oceanivirga salmonicida]
MKKIIIIFTTFIFSFLTYTEKISNENNINKAVNTKELKEENKLKKDEVKEKVQKTTDSVKTETKDEVEKTVNSVDTKELKGENLPKKDETKDKTKKSDDSVDKKEPKETDKSKNDETKDKAKKSDDSVDKKEPKETDKPKKDKTKNKVKKTNSVEKKKGFKHIKDYENVELDNLEFDITLEEFERNYDNYVFIKRNSNLRELPTVKSKRVSRANKYDKLELLALEKNEINEKWYKVKTNEGTEAYIRSDLVIKREYNYEDAIKEIEKLNTFVEKYKGKIRVLSKFVPLDTSSDGKVDAKGNYANQSVTVYTDETEKELYNLPDRAIFTIIDESKKHYVIVSPFYEMPLYFPKKFSKYIGRTKIDEKINKFIYISKGNQNQITFELDENGNYKVKLISDVTTGKKSKYGFETPNGYFLVALTKPVMKYVNDSETEEIKIVGEAKYAIRFSGGAYMHGVPYKYEPEETLESRKINTKALLGTYAISHKCVRNYDEVVEYLYHWIKYSHVNKAGHRILKEPVMVIVK